MFIVGYKMRYAHGVHLNEVSGPGTHGAGWSGAEAATQVLARAAQRIGEHGERVGGQLKKLVGGASKREPRSARFRRAAALQFVIEPLKVPSVVRPSHEPHVVYVRLAAPSGADTVAVMPEPAAAVRHELAEAERAGRPVQRAVLVGADSIVDPAAFTALGHGAALNALVQVIEALATAHIPFVWRTRGGIDGPIPHALADVLAAAGALATVELGVPTLDRDLCAALEGHPGADPEHRLRLGAALASRGVIVRGLVDPLVPMLTDQQQALAALMGAFAEAGIPRVGARYIVLTRERARAVANRLAGMQRALLQGVFADEPWNKPDPEGGQREVHKRIPAHLRRAGHHRLLEAGARHGMFVEILDPVDESEDLSAAPSPTEPDGDKPKKVKPVRRRPQLELFRKSR